MGPHCSARSRDTELSSPGLTFAHFGEELLRWIHPSPRSPVLGLLSFKNPSCPSQLTVSFSLFSLYRVEACSSRLVNLPIGSRRWCLPSQPPPPPPSLTHIFVLLFCRFNLSLRFPSSARLAAQTFVPQKSSVAITIILPSPYQHSSARRPLFLSASLPVAAAAAPLPNSPTTDSATANRPMGS